MADSTEIARAAEARVDIATKLNLTAGLIERANGLLEELSPQLLAGLMREASTIISDGEKFRPPAEGNYMRAINQYREELEAALEIAHDPFKAPEQTVETFQRVNIAGWHMAVEFAALSRREK